jgi:hypothetical protein
MAQQGSTFQIPQAAREVIRSGKCVVFIGSGLSAGSYDSWSNLVNALCEHCGVNDRVSEDSPPDDLLDAAQRAKNQSEHLYLGFLGQHFGQPASHASLLYDALLALPFECYLTVNFDPLLALKGRTARRRCTLPARAYPSLDRKHATARTIHYLHGIVQENERPAHGPVVLTRDEFDDAYRDNSNLMNFLLPTLENDPIVFVGCRLKEPAMARVFDICKEHQRERMAVAIKHGRPSSPPPKRFIMLPQPIVHARNGESDSELGRLAMQEQDQFYKSRDIEPLWYVASGRDHSTLRLAFDRLADLPTVQPNYGWDGGGDVT